MHGLAKHERPSPGRLASDTTWTDGSRRLRPREPIVDRGLPCGSHSTLPRGISVSVQRRIFPGSPYPLGATWDGDGVNFAVYSEHATRVELCLANDKGDEEHLSLPERTAFVWHGYIPGIGPKQLYGYRLDGPYDPNKGMRFNPNNLLLDPYAKAIDGHETWEKGLFAYEVGDPEGDLKMRANDARGVPLSVVIDPSFDWGNDRSPQTPFHKSVIYEVHVRGATMRHPEVPAEARGTFSGLSSEPMIRHFKDLGITALELMPIHAFVDDKFLLDRGLRNYWGYSSIAYFSPETRYRRKDYPGSGVREFKTMVKDLHAAGIEVILDVVYNHTAEGNHLGPTFCYKGIDNQTYYRLSPDNPRFYFDYTGTGNTLNVRHPQTLQLIMDSLRYWVVEMHVDGFRFDLASALARSLKEVDQLSSFFTIIHQDPVLSQVKLIAEPWDIGDGGYQVGNFPIRWTEWNGKYRDAVRSFWKGQGAGMGEFGYRLTGSSDLYQNDGRAPYSSINFITAHDGFTLADLVSYDNKHNEANGEDNKDGTDDNKSWNCGAEGPTEDGAIRALRQRQMRNLMATLLLSQGTPMICGGDEFGRTQNGNNNAFCQDNEISWYDWSLDDDRKRMLAFTKRVIALRKRHPALRRAKFFKGRKIYGTDARDLLWFTSEGKPMNDGDWNTQWAKSLTMFLGGQGLDAVSPTGRPVVDDDLLMLVNGNHEALTFTMPDLNVGAWELLLDTANDDAANGKNVAHSNEPTKVEARSLKLFRRPNAATAKRPRDEKDIE
jgi:isoamylase